MASETEAQHWSKKWKEGRIGWHKSSIDDMLQKYYTQYIGNGNTVFVTLCGKSLDMIWLAEKGHTVVGCDIVELAAQQFFTDNNIPFKKYDIENFIVYESIADKLNIKLLVGDILHCTTQTIGYTFDSIWDCNALVAISPSDRKRYVDTLSSLLKADGVILLSTYEYQDGLRNEAPFSLPQDILGVLFEKLQLNLLESEKSERLMKKFELPWAKRNMYFVKKL